MTRLEAIKEQIRQLSPAEFSQLREWLEQQRNAAAGKLEELFQRAEQRQPISTSDALKARDRGRR